MNSISSRSKRHALKLLVVATMAVALAPTPAFAYDENSAAAINVDQALSLIHI